MVTLYERLTSLCEEKGIKGGRMCTELGISKSLMTDLKMGRQTGISAVNAQKIASYFDVSVGYLLGEDENKKPTDDNRLSAKMKDKEIYCEKKQVLIRMDHELYEKLSKYAEQEERDTPKQIIWILKQYVKKMEEENPR